MRSRPAPDADLAEVARQRLELLSAEIAGGRADLPSPRTDGQGDEPGDLLPRLPGRHARRSVGRQAQLAGWLHDRLPATLQGRIRLGLAHLAVLAVTIASGLAVTAWWVLRTDDAGTLVPAVSSPGAQPATPLVTAAVPAATPAAAAVVVVDVAGRVRRPGIATLPVGARVVDALQAAGGVRRGVDRGSINLARVLVDGEQIVVGGPAPSGPAASSMGSSPAAEALVNLNTADQATLEALPGVGPVTAQSIMAWREEHGGFTSVDELLEVSGIGDATLAELAPYVTL